MLHALAILASLLLATCLAVALGFGVISFLAERNPRLRSSGESLLLPVLIGDTLDDDLHALVRASYLHETRDPRCAPRWRELRRALMRVQIARHAQSAPSAQVCEILRQSLAALDEHSAHRLAELPELRNDKRPVPLAREPASWSKSS